MAPFSALQVANSGYSMRRGRNQGLFYPLRSPSISLEASLLVSVPASHCGTIPFFRLRLVRKEICFEVAGWGAFTLYVRGTGLKSFGSASSK